MIATRSIWIPLLAFVAGIAMAQGVYKWKDKDGNWHFADQPPPGQKAETIRVSPGHYAPASELSSPDMPLTLNILTPEPAMTAAGDWVQIVGEFTGPPDTGVSVEGMPAISQDGRHFLARAIIHPGHNDIPIALTTLDGRTQQRTITVNRSDSASPHLRLAADDVCGLVPSEVAFHIEGIPASMRLVEASFDFNANGVPDANIKDVSQHPTYRYDSSGLYAARAAVTLADIGDPAKVEQRTLEQYVFCGDRAYIRQTLIFLYESMRAALGKKDVAAALRVFASDRRSEYEHLFRAIAASDADVTKQLGTLEDGLIMPRTAMGLLVRNENGASHGFPIEFGMGNDGVWRITQM
ncbi:MAG TPA: DUF4124 domain-containing protein [Rhodanobacteraceae bacterium]|jgi:hypothetical protein|nr:DUF4124 domain-containing protein [Rhodanobacteraceae bacterium]